MLPLKHAKEQKLNLNKRRLLPLLIGIVLLSSCGTRDPDVAIRQVTRGLNRIVQSIDPAVDSVQLRFLSELGNAKIDLTLIQELSRTALSSSSAEIGSNEAVQMLKLVLQRDVQIIPVSVNARNSGTLALDQLMLSADPDNRQVFETNKRYYEDEEKLGQILKPLTEVSASAITYPAFGVPEQLLEDWFNDPSDANLDKIKTFRERPLYNKSVIFLPNICTGEQLRYRLAHELVHVKIDEKRRNTQNLNAISHPDLGICHLQQWLG